MPTILEDEEAEAEGDDATHAQLPPNINKAANGDKTAKLSESVNIQVRTV